MKSLYEKITLYGAGALSDEQLIGIMVDNAELGCRIINTISMTEIANADISRLRMVEGMGMAKAAKIAAAAELGKRISRAEADNFNYILSDKDAVNFFKQLFASLQHEECWAVFLNNSSRIIDKMKISQGGVQATIVDRKLILKRAVELLATRIIIAHNHPSGKPEPSRADIDMTAQLRQAAELFDITLLDHIIITTSGTYSFKAHKLL